MPDEKTGLVTDPALGTLPAPDGERGLTAAYVRERNVSAILRVLRRQGSVSRSGLASLLGLSRSGMTPIVAEMVDRGLVQETAGTSTQRGRPPIMLSLTADELCVVGIELRRDRVGCLVETLDGSFLHEIRRPHDSVPHDPHQAAEMVSSLVRDTQQALGRAVVGIGVCLPGTPRPNGLVDSPVLGWDSVPVTSLIRESLGSLQPRIVVADIAAAATLGVPTESEVSCRRAHIQFGPGLGLGLCDLQLGAVPMPETRGLGHVGWPGATTACWCGSRGCLDTVLGLHVVRDELCRRVGIPLPDHAATMTAPLTEALRRNPAEALAWQEELAARIAWVVRLVAQVEQPDVITLGGYVSQLDDRFEASLRALLAPQEGIPEGVRVQRLSSDDAPMIGVAAAVGNAVLETPLQMLDEVDSRAA